MVLDQVAPGQDGIERAKANRPLEPQSALPWRTAAKLIALVVGIGAVASLVQAGSVNSLLAGLSLLVVARGLFKDLARATGRVPEVHGRQMGIVTATCAPVGRVSVDGVSWQARALDQEPLEPGECVYVHDVDGEVLAVSRQEPAARSD
jgi:membrane protein implicated in regulation of membrane protease activity